jgi:alpha-amylase
MKKVLILLIAVLSIGLFSCNKTQTPNDITENPETITEIPTDKVETPLENADSKYLTGDYNLAKNIQDGVILHAWNWSYNTIRMNLKNIAEAGFSTVQTSPVQQPKSYNGSSSVKNTWWKLYQPVSFTVGDGWLGSKEELTLLCQEAENYGIKIICDIVVNHMANVTDFDGYYPEIEEYESEIFNNPEKYFHPYTKDGEDFGTSDSDLEALTQGSLSGLPDLNTSSEYVQERVLSLLKECVDCGVSGFRFDAAKHIETPDDGEFASNFWPNVLDPTTAYAKEKYNRDMYYYGEILNTPGNGRKISSYTKYMSVTDSGLSGNIYNRMSSQNADLLLKSLSEYSYKLEANKAVLWVESHDTYMSSSSNSKDSSPKLPRAWGIVANRLDATALYFVRPGDAGMGECGTYYWMSQEVTAVNQFHNAFIKASENFSISNGFLVGERYREEDKKAGVIITNITNASNITQISNVKVSHLADGTYYDQISGNKFIVKNGLVSGEIGSSSKMVILYDKEVNIKPQIMATQSAKYIYDGVEATLTLDVKNAKEISYSINGGEKISIEANGTIKVNTKSTVTVYAKGDSEVSQTFEFKTVEKKDGYWCVAGINESTLEAKNVYAWVWPNGGEGSWREVTVVNGVAYVEQTSKDYGMLLAFFDKDITIDKANWNLSPTQTDDFKDLNSNTVYFAGV